MPGPARAPIERIGSSGAARGRRFSASGAARATARRGARPVVGDPDARGAARSRLRSDRSRGVAAAARGESRRAIQSGARASRRPGYRLRFVAHAEAEQNDRSWLGTFRIVVARHGKGCGVDARHAADLFILRGLRRSVTPRVSGSRRALADGATLDRSCSFVSTDAAGLAIGHAKLLAGLNGSERKNLKKSREAAPASPRPTGA